MKFLYLSIDAFTLLGPLILSFDKRVAFYKKWKPLFLAISIMMIIFIPWDILKTDHGVWGFNQDYICGIYFFNLPIEECLFFVCIPYACIFIYECLNYYLKKDLLLKY
ncbi:MAG: lycopene cyclase domain-containing protein, partial [Bacteroidota bacterium]